MLSQNIFPRIYARPILRHGHLGEDRYWGLLCRDWPLMLPLILQLEVVVVLELFTQVLLDGVDLLQVELKVPILVVPGNKYFNLNVRKVQARKDLNDFLFGYLIKHFITLNLIADFKVALKR